MARSLNRSLLSLMGALAMGATFSFLAPAGDAHAQESLPQQCGQMDGEADYGALSVGSRIRLGYHTPVYGDANWSTSMSDYVGSEATVTSLGATDEAGCPVVHVDIDGGAFAWRIRNAQLLSAPVTTRRFGSTFSVSTRASDSRHVLAGRVGTGTLTDVSRLTDEGMGFIDLSRPAAVIRHDGTDAFEVLVHSEDVDTVLLIETPSGEFVFVDDTDEGLDPASGELFAPGTYRVWVGTYGEEDQGSFAMLVTSDEGVSTESVPAYMRVAR